MGGVKDKIAQAENVRACALLVSRGEAPLGIVYRSDAVVRSDVKIVYTFPADIHPPSSIRRRQRRTRRTVTPLRSLLILLSHAAKTCSNSKVLSRLEPTGSRNREHLGFRPKNGRPSGSA